MSLVKYAGVSLIAMSASMGHAGGMEDTALSAGFMFEDGSYGSVSVKSQSPSVKGYTRVELLLPQVRWLAVLRPQT